MFEYLDSLKTAIKNSKNALLNVPEIEVKVLEATSNDPWGPSSTQMREIAKATYSYTNFPLIMNTIWRRLADDVKYWRHIYKGLVLLENLIKLGSEQVLREARVHVMELQALTEFSHIEDDKDVGVAVREKAKQIVELMHDERRMHEEREKAKQLTSKFLSFESSEGRRTFNSNRREDSWERPPPQYSEDYEESSYDDVPKRSTYRNDYSSSVQDPEESFRRPRAPSDSDKDPLPKPQTPVNPVKSQANLIDLDDIFSTQSTPAAVPTPKAPQTTHTNPFANKNTDSSTSFFDLPSAPTTAHYTPTAASTALPTNPPKNSNSFQSSNNATNDFEWDDFKKHESFTEKSQTPNDPWAHKDLFDFSTLTVPSKPSSAASKAPVSAVSRPSTAPITNQNTGMWPNQGGLPTTSLGSRPNPSPMMGTPITGNSSFGMNNMGVSMGNPNLVSPGIGGMGNSGVGNASFGMTNNPSMRPNPVPLGIPNNAPMGLPAGGMTNNPTYNPNMTYSMGNPAMGNSTMGNPAMGNPAMGNYTMGNPAMVSPSMGTSPFYGNPNMVSPGLGMGNSGMGNVAYGSGVPAGHPMGMNQGMAMNSYRGTGTFPINSGVQMRPGRP